MTNRVPTLAATALYAVTFASFANVASATPIADALAIKNAAPPVVETVQWRGRGGGWGRRGGGWGGGGFGWGIGAGVLGAAIIGGALAAPYYGYGYDEYGPGAYYGPGYVVGPPVYYRPSPYYAPGWGGGW
jgi:hypothetical protein